MRRGTEFRYNLKTARKLTSRFFNIYYANLASTKHAFVYKRQRELVADFMELLLVRNFSVRMFDPAGQDDIGGGCGQLWHVQKWMQTHPELVRKQITA